VKQNELKFILSERQRDEGIPVGTTTPAEKSL